MRAVICSMLMQHDAGTRKQEQPGRRQDALNQSQDVLDSAT
jgi:hypothetical protein